MSEAIPISEVIIPSTISNDISAEYDREVKNSNFSNDDDKNSINVRDEDTLSSEDRENADYSLQKGIVDKRVDHMKDFLTSLDVQQDG